MKRGQSQLRPWTLLSSAAFWWPWCRFLPMAAVAAVARPGIHGIFWDILRWIVLMDMEVPKVWILRFYVFCFFENKCVKMIILLRWNLGG